MSEISAEFMAMKVGVDTLHATQCKLRMMNFPTNFHTLLKIIIGYPLERNGQDNTVWFWQKWQALLGSLHRRSWKSYIH